MKNNTRTARIPAGERIRAIRFDISIDADDGRTVKVPVTISHRWPVGTAMPSHACIADECDDCVEQARLRALRLQAGELAGVYVKQDHQTVAR